MREREFGKRKPLGAPIAFGAHFAGSNTFRSLFKDGMGLVEETAAYLDGVGREESRVLPRSIAAAYAAESMRLTTRLMRLASWLLLQRSVNEGEMTLEQALAEKAKMRLGGIEARLESAAWDGLPEGFQELVERSFHLQQRIRKIDMAIYRPAPLLISDNPVARQIGRISAAFEAKSQ
jgi:regulator of CtrA degradation